MYKISEFSLITSFTIKTLHYYDEENILKPSYRNEFGHRIYTEKDYEKAKTIKLLKKFNFSISEIKEFVENSNDLEDLSYYLKEKKNEIIKNIKDEEQIIREIDYYIINEEKLVVMDEDYKFEIKEINPIDIISYRFSGKYEDTGKYIGKLFKLAKNNIAGKSFNLYYDEGYEEEANIEICLPVSKKIESKDIEYRQLPKINALVTRHKGSYETIYKAYKKIIDFGINKDLVLGLPSREVHIKGPGPIFKGNVDKYITEIIIPIEVENGKENRL